MTLGAAHARFGGRVLVVGGAGFIGSHLVDALLREHSTEKVTVYDNFSSGRTWHLTGAKKDRRFSLVRGDIKDMASLQAAMDGHTVVLHLASNPDIARAATEPAIDFEEGILLTHYVLEAMRRTGATRMLYSSGSGVYGDIAEVEPSEDFGPMVPISTYGSSKLAGEAMIAAYSHMFDLASCVFRLGNVVGSRQTHGVGFDFIHKLVKDATRLDILGDGTQSKSYVHVDDVVTAVLLAHGASESTWEAYNVATGDYMTVAEIAEIAIECVGVARDDVKLVFADSDRGWKGDVPIVRLDTSKIRKMGWNNRMGSREAIRASMMSILADARAGRL